MGECCIFSCLSQETKEWIKFTFFPHIWPSSSLPLFSRVQFLKGMSRPKLRARLRWRKTSSTHTSAGASSGWELLQAPAVKKKWASVNGAKFAHICWFIQYARTSGCTHMHEPTRVRFNAHQRTRGPHTDTRDTSIQDTRSQGTPAGHTRTRCTPARDSYEAHTHNTYT